MSFVEPFVTFAKRNRKQIKREKKESKSMLINSASSCIIPVFALPRAEAQNMVIRHVNKDMNI